VEQPGCILSFIFL